MKTALRFIATATFAAFASAVAQAAPIAMTADQYRLYKRYVTALAEPAVQKLAPAKRIAFLAKKLSVREPILRDAVTTGDALAPTIADACKKEIRAELEATPLSGQVVDVDIDASTGHVVTYVEWRSLDVTKLEVEAVTIAMIAAKAAPITSTVAIWARDTSKQKIFEATISAESASHFQAARIDMFGRTRYIQMFENVHRGAEIKPESDRPAPPH